MPNLSKLYGSPLRVYLLLGALAAAGLWCGLHLPISLFPNSAKPEVYVQISYGTSTADEFLHSFGTDLEAQLRRLNSRGVEVESIEAQYLRRQAEYRLKFQWGMSPQLAEREVANVVNSFASRLSQESRESIYIGLRSQNGGFLAISFYSESRSLDALYDLLKPALMPQMAQVNDASNPVLYNPDQREVRIDLKADVMATLQLVPRNIDEALQSELRGTTGGSVSNGKGTIQLEMPRQIQRLEDLNQVIIPTPSGKIIHLSDVARIDWAPKSGSNEIFKSSGSPSLILWAAPRPGGNVKRMSEQMIGIVNRTLRDMPKDIHTRVLVDPSQFIRSAIQNVFQEVCLAALLAVVVLFVFIGSFRNVVTAAIEIPLSIVLAFILMRLFGINLNLISLGGLALSAGMNVDASVVVMENIFRHFAALPGRHDAPTRLRILSQAVSEVRFPIIASTLSSLVVFLPLTFTSNLSYALLGDLAYAVVFSHGFSAIVALILVPTIRFQLMAKGNEKQSHSPLERPIVWVEKTYARLLEQFVTRPGIQISTLVLLLASLGALFFIALPRLPREIVGLPDTDWIVLDIFTEGNTSSRQLETTVDEIERDVTRLLGHRLDYTFTQVYDPSEGSILARLRDKKDMKTAWNDMEKRFRNTPFVKFTVAPWNPSELPIPDPPALQLDLIGPNSEKRGNIAADLSDRLEESKLYSRLSTIPNTHGAKTLTFQPRMDQWQQLTKNGITLHPSDLADISLVATSGRQVGKFPLKNESVPIILRYSDGIQRASPKHSEDIISLPLGIGAKIVPLSALMEVKSVLSPASFFRIDSQELTRIEGRLDKAKESLKGDNLKKAKVVVEQWIKDHKAVMGDSYVVQFQDADRELNDAIHQLAIALGLSLSIMFLTLLIQFGSLGEALIVLVSVPLGFIGVLFSLYVFHSTLSLNSILGIILLNGIAVANSILLVDFGKRLLGQGLSPHDAVVEAARKRLRPILITSATTILGMVPITMGMGEGGRILQPLGIAVAGGLGVSTLFTLFLVPALHCFWLRRGIRVATDQNASQATTMPSPSHLSLTWIVAPVFLIGLLFSAPLSATDSPQALSFEQAVSAIVDRSTTVGIQKGELERTRAKNIPAGYSFLPQLTLSASEFRSADNSNTSVGSYGATSSLNLFRFGADIAAFRAAGLEEQSHEQFVAASILKTESEAATALIGVLQSEMETQVFKETSDMTKRLLDNSKERFQKGFVPSQEVEKIEIDLANALAEARDAQIRVQQFRAELRSLLGHDNIVMEWPWKDRFEKQGTSVLSSLANEVTKRPDWIAYEKKVGAADKRIDQYFGKLLPSLDLNFAYNSDLRSTTGLPGSYWSGALTLTVPILDGLVSYSDYREKIKSKGIAELEFEQTKRSARKEWQSSEATLGIATETARSREITVQMARRIYTENLKRFERGLVNANDLAVEYRRFLTSELLAVKGWAGAHQSLVQVCLSAGQRLKECLSVWDQMNPAAKSKS